MPDPKPLTRSMLQRFRTERFFRPDRNAFAEEAEAAIKALSGTALALMDELERCKVALDDWSRSYAPECYDPEHVAETRSRLDQHGTVGYIAIRLDAIRHLLREDDTSTRKDGD